VKIFWPSTQIISAEKDFDLLAKRNVSVAHCPRSHDYFRHEPISAEKNYWMRTSTFASAPTAFRPTRKNGKQKPELDLSPRCARLRQMTNPFCRKKS